MTEASTSVHVFVKKSGNSTQIGEWRAEPTPTLWVRDHPASPSTVEWVDGEKEVLQQIARAGFPVLDEEGEPECDDGTSPHTNRGYGRVRRIVTILGAVVLFCRGFSMLDERGWLHVTAGLALMYAAFSIYSTVYALEEEIRHLRLEENHRWLAGE